MLARTALRAGAATLLVSISMLVAAVPPAAAVIVTQPCTGLCGHWQLKDAEHDGGVNCVYVNKLGGKILKITVRPPQMYGRYTLTSTVGWRFIVQEDLASTWSNVYTSTYQNAQANLLTSASQGFGFSRRGWSGPFDPQSLAYRVILEMRWQQNGSTEGTVKGRYKWYLLVAQGNKYTSLYLCDPTYDG